MTAGTCTFGFCTDEALEPTYPVSGIVKSLVLADVNADGHLDAVTGGVNVLPGQGDGSFALAMQYPVSGPGLVETADFNGDGRLDLVTTTGDSTIGFLMNQGSGTFALMGDYALPMLVNSLVAADLNGDDQPDVAVWTFQGGQVAPIHSGEQSTPGLSVIRLLLNQGDGTFALVTPAQGNGILTPAQMWLSPSDHPLAAADLDRDGLNDLLFAHEGGYSVEVLLNEGNGSYVKTSVSAGGGPSMVAAADFDADGWLDVAVTVNGGGGDHVSVMLNQGKGSFGPRIDLSTDTKWRLGPLATVDIDGDGDEDVVAAAYKSLSLWRNQGGGVFSPRCDYRAPDTSIPIAAADLDHDGRTDLVVLDERNKAVVPLFQRDLR